MKKTLSAKSPFYGPSVASVVVANQLQSGWLKGKQAVAQHLDGVSVKTIDSWVERRLLPFTRLPGSRLMLFRRADVDAAMARFQTEAMG